VVFIILILLLVGVFAGFMAGLLGIGGGVIIVPAVYIVLKLPTSDKQSSINVANATAIAIYEFSKNTYIQG